MALWAGGPIVIGAFLLWATRGQTFYADEWAFFTRSAGFNAERLLAPHQGNMVLSTVLVYKLVLALVGAENHLAFRLVWIGLDLLCAWLLFSLLRVRVGDFAALAGALLVSVFGAGWEFFGSSLGITAFVCVAGGLGGLLALERRRKDWDALACLLLAISLASLSTGLAFLAGAAALIVIGPQWRRRIFVVAIPLLLYAAWTLWARKYNSSGVTVETVASAPASMVDSLASASSALFGAFRIPGPGEEGASKLVTFVNKEPGYLLGGLLVVALAWRIGTAGFKARVAVPLTMLFVYWLSLALVSPARIPSTGRYQYAASIFILLLLAEAWRGWRPSRGAQVGIAVALLLAIVPNLANLGYASKFVRETSAKDRAILAVADHLEDRVAPGTILQPPPFGIAEDMVIDSDDYFRATREFGSPGDTIGQLPSAGPAARDVADREFVYLLGFAPEPAAALPTHRCRTVAPGEIGLPGFPVPTGGFAFQSTDGSDVTVGLRRYGDDYFRFEPSSGGGPFRLAVGADGIARPWFAALEASAQVRVCALS
ncbi:MAG TPA: hypothetical protein VH042_01135 [Solirubrobacterales bacterium]|jgi:hypothetical protein|nr:hypothetical protein [Solirubrobacterales bacterium]